MMSEKQDTKALLLDTAERLFADEGIGQVSLRKIVAAADVNVASVNYHFGSKDELIREVFKRRIEHVNAMRLEALEALRAKFGAEPIPVRELMRAFVSPVIELGRSESGGRTFFRLVARAQAETNPALQRELFGNLREIVQIFLKEFERSLPELDPVQRSLRLAFTAGAMVHSVLFPLKALFASEFLTGDFKEEDVVEHLLDYICGGMIASRGAGQ